jgi:hypothetical protein|nr:MAG TPA: hypothetical protein [Caudoviricetes sp.]
MKKIFFALFFLFNFVFANCDMKQRIDEMTDKPVYIMVCSNMDTGIRVAIFPKNKTLEIQEDELDVVIDLLNGGKFKAESIEGLREFQTIEIRIDKNKSFLSEGWIDDVGDMILLRFNKEQQKQIINGDALIVRYTTTNNRLNTQKIDISGFKKFK